MSSADRGQGSGEAFARAALAGNPSDGYGGAVVAFAFDEHRARVTATRARSLTVEPSADLIDATVRRFARQHTPAAASSAISWTTTIPRGVGLGGSSAIVIATLRALCDLHEVDLDPVTLAGLALAVETEELGIAAGLQDRVTQAHDALMFMDFGADRRAADGHGRYEQLDSAALPPLVIAWRPDASEESGGVHAPLRERFDRAEDAVVAGMVELGDLAHRARRAIETGNHPELRRCVDGSFDARARILELDSRHVEMIECARAHGAAANYTGSGGAIVAVCADAAQRASVRGALERIGAEAITPSVAGGAGG